MSRNGQLEAGLKRITEDYHLPGGGRRKLSELVAEHLYWFDAAERRGMSWRDMIGALSGAGLTGKGGTSLSVGTLSSTVWRIRAEAEAEMNSAAGHTRRGSPDPAVPLRLQKKGKQLSKGRRRGRTSSETVAIKDQPQPSRPATKASERVLAQNRDVLAFMDRSRAVRRRSE